MRKKPAPALRIAAWYLIGLGILMTATAGLTDGQAVTASQLVLNGGSGLLAIAAGIGLLRHSWWGWALGALVAIAGIGFGLYAMGLFGHDITQMGANYAVLLLWVGPGVLLAGVLVSPATIRLFRDRSTLAYPPPLPPPPA